MIRSRYGKSQRNDHADIMILCFMMNDFYQIVILINSCNLMYILINIVWIYEEYNNLSYLCYNTTLISLLTD